MTDFAKLVMAVDATGMAPGDQALDRLAAKGAQTEAQITKATANMSKGMAQVGGSAKNMGPAVQNAAFQVTDFAVQVASGTDATRAFAQQMPQLLGGLGVFGAVAGAAVAVGAALWPILSKVGEEAKKTDDALDDLNDSLRSYERYASDASRTTLSLVEQFGAGANRARDLFSAMKSIEELKFAREMGAALKALNAEFSGITDLMALWDTATNLPSAMRADAINLAREAAEKLHDTYGLTLGQARALTDAISAAKMAEGPEETAVAMNRLVAVIISAHREGAKLPDGLLEAAQAAGELGLSAERMAAIMAGLPPGIDGAGQATRAWADAMGAVGAELQGILSAIASLDGVMIGNAAKFVELEALNAGKTAAQAARARKEFEINTEFSAREMGATNPVERLLIQQERAAAMQGLDLDERIGAARAAALKREREAGRSGSGRGGKAADSYERSVIEIQRQTEAFLAQADALAKVATAGGDWERALAVIEEEQKLLNAAQRAGIELTPEVKAQINEMAQAYVDAETALERIRTSTERGQDAFRDLFGSILEGAGSAKQALANLLMQMAKVQFAKGMLGILGGTSLGSTLIKSVGDSLTFDGGGYTGDGPRSGGLDGKGGFMAMLHPHETVIDHTKGQSAGGGVVKVIAQHDPGILMRVIDSRVDAAKPGFVSQAVSAARYDASENPWP